AVVTDRHHRAEVADGKSFTGRRGLLARERDVLLQALQQGGKTGAASNGDYTQGPGGTAVLRRLKCRNQFGMTQKPSSNPPEGADSAPGSGYSNSVNRGSSARF